MKYSVEKTTLNTLTIRHDISVVCLLYARKDVLFSSGDEISAANNAHVGAGHWGRLEVREFFK
jgi:hypothetical protein